MDFKEKILKMDLLKIKVIPNSEKTDFFWEMEDWTFKLKSRWVPEKWKVNSEIIKFLSKFYWVEKSKIKIISWQKNRNKIIKIEND